jgi:ketosteroid isomerase-like protein
LTSGGLAVPDAQRHNRRVSVTDRLLTAMTARDAEAFAACFARDYDSKQPAHPARAFRGREQVLQNWTAVFAGVPDFRAELIAHATTGDVEIGEWRWSGTHLDGAAFEMRGVTVLGVADDLVQWGRLYMEPVEAEGGAIDEMVRDTYRPPA